MFMWLNYEFLLSYALYQKYHEIYSIVLAVAELNCSSKTQLNVRLESMLNESLFHVVGKWHENQIFVLSKTPNYKRYIPDRIMLKAATVLSFESVSTHETAEEAIKIWKIRPNVVNRRLCGSAEIWTANADGARIDIVDDLFGKLKEQYPQLSLKDTNELRTVLGVKSNEDDAFLYSKVAQSNCLSRSDVVVDETCTVDGSGACTLSNIPRRDIPTADRINHIVLRKLLPRSLVKFRTTVEIVAKTENLDSGNCKSVQLTRKYLSMVFVPKDSVRV